jgi:hypothetical protein
LACNNRKCDNYQNTTEEIHATGYSETIPKWVISDIHHRLWLDRILARYWIYMYGWTAKPLIFAHFWCPEGVTNYPPLRRPVPDIRPIPDAIRDEIVQLQYRWSDETDIHAEPWTM